MINKEQFEFSGDYEWSGPDINRLETLLQDVSREFLGAEPTVYGSIENFGPPKKRQSPDDLAGWCRSLSAPWDSASLNLNSIGNGRSIRLYLSKERIQVYIETSPDGVAEATGLLQKFEGELQLRKKTAESNFDEEASWLSVNRKYHKPKTDRSDWLAEFVTSTQSLLSQTPRFDGGYQLNSATHDLHLIRNFETWHEAVIEQWANLDSFDFYLRFGNARIHLDYRFENEQLSLMVETKTQSQITEIFESIEQKFPLKPIGEVNALRAEATTGFRRRYFVKDNAAMDADWLNHAITSLLSYCRGRVYFDGNFRLVSSPREEQVARSPEVWRDKVGKHWNEIISSYAWIDNDSIKLQFICDRMRESVDLRVEAPTLEETERIIGEIEQKLRIQPLAEEDPYRYRRSLGNFSIVGWRNEKFSEAVELAIQQFVGDKYALVEAYVEFGAEKSKQLEHFEDLPSFLKRLCETKPYSDAFIGVDGPRGIALGVTVYDDLKKIEIKSTLNANEFPELTRIFDRQIKLKEIKDSEKEDLEKKTKADLSNSIWVKVVLPILTLVLGATILSPTFWNAVTPKTQLHITVPSVPAGQSLTITGTQEIPIEWTLETEQWFQKTINRESPATIRVLKDGLIEVQKLDGQYSGLSKVALNTGVYDIEVISRETGLSDKVRVIISP